MTSKKITSIAPPLTLIAASGFLVIAAAHQLILSTARDLCTRNQRPQPDDFVDTLASLDKDEAEAYYLGLDTETVQH